MNTKIILIRHGESVGNAKGVYLGHTNFGLSELGKKQAEIAADYLKNERIDVIYSSDLARAHETAVPHARIHGIPVNDSVELREVDIGDWEGMYVKDLVENHYQEFVVEWKEKFGTFKFPGGESVLHAASRFYGEVLRIAKENIGKTILITAHAAVIRAFWCTVLGVKPEEMGKTVPFPTNTSLSTVEFDGERFIPVEYSCDSHLKE